MKVGIMPSPESLPVGGSYLIIFADDRQVAFTWILERKLFHWPGFVLLEFHDMTSTKGRIVNFALNFFLGPATMVRKCCQSEKFPQKKVGNFELIINISLLSL